MKIKLITSVLFFASSFLFSSQLLNNNNAYSIKIIYANGEGVGFNDNAKQEALALFYQQVEVGLRTQGLIDIELQIDRQAGSIVLSAFYDDGSFGMEYLQRN